MREQQAKFITLEGGEGVGKSTALTYLKNAITKAGIDVVVTREPGGCPRSEAIRQLLLSDAFEQPMDIDCELLLLYAARAQHIRSVIKPALAEGKWVICDRFIDATYAYQGGGRGVDIDRIDQLNQWLTHACMPDVTLLLQAPLLVGLDRMAKRGSKDRFEREDEMFFHRVNEVYERRMQADTDRFYCIDAGVDVKSVQKQLDAWLDKLWV